MPADIRADAIARILDAALDEAGAGSDEVSSALAQLGLDPGETADLGDRVQRARVEHARLRRREQELSALFSSARELAEVRDGDALLARLVQRAHAMMRADVTYLSEFDPATRELRVRETTGSVSAEFPGLRVPPGRGLASVIVETRTPQSVTRYDDYERERHEPGIDDAVAAEGLVSLLGVPMLSGDDVLGVLFVANREAHTFARDEIALLSALADHASVVLQTARTLRDLRDSEDETRRALDSLTEHLGSRDRAHTVHQELVQAVLGGGGFSPVAETLSSALARSVTIVDAREHVIAAAGLPVAAAMVELDGPVREAIAESRRSGYSVVVEGSPGISAVVALTAGVQHFGAVLLGEGDFELGPVDRRTVERAAQVGALLALQQEAVAGADHRVQSELITDLLDDVPERRADVDRRATRIGIPLDELDSLLLFAVPGEHRTAAARAIAPFLDGRTLIGEYRGFVVAAFASARFPADQGAAAEQLRARIAHAIQRPVLAVAGPPAAGALPASCTAAMRTARLLAALGVDDIATSTDGYLPYAAVLDTDARSLSAFLDETIGAVRRYDSERGADLLGTLRAFVRSNASPTRTARDLNFHTNTILQRLERLDQVLGEGWRDDERLFRIGIAVRLDDLRERLLRTSASPAG